MWGLCFCSQHFPNVWDSVFFRAEMFGLLKDKILLVFWSQGSGYSPRVSIKSLYGVRPNQIPPKGRVAKNNGKGMMTQDQLWCSGGKNPHSSLTKSSCALRLCMQGMLGKSSHHGRNWVSNTIFELKKIEKKIILSPTKNVLHSGLSFESHT